MIDIEEDVQELSIEDRVSALELAMSGLLGPTERGASWAGFSAYRKRMRGAAVGALQSTTEET